MTVSNTVPRFATCTIGQCTRPAVRGLSCGRCKNHLCVKHQSSQFHGCPSGSQASWEKAIDDEVAELLSALDANELARVASSLNGGNPCVFRPGQHLGTGAIMGCANYHGWLDFEDGQKWLVRIPRTGFGTVPADLIEYFVAREYATLKFLETTKVPAAKAFGSGLASDPANHVGVNYILMEALPGKPYYSHEATEDQKKHVLAQIADVMVEISNHPFRLAGSCVVEDGQVKVAEVASDRFINLGRYGPFESDAAYFASIIEQHLDLIADGQLYHTCPKEAFLFYRLFAQNIDELCGDEPRDTFFLKHVDDKGDHILIDDKYNIVGIIDWQFARTVPAREAFGPSLLTADLDCLYSGKAGITKDDMEIDGALRLRGREDLATFASGDELIRRFQLGLPSGFTRAEIRQLTKAVLVTLRPGEDDINMEGWESDEWVRCRDDYRTTQIESLISEQISLQMM
ncbi:uncharacterized protein EI97DRAFT_368619 [Westerdykella ornata]|uniref:Aminoglycoside phosphotransferase domain-containing protein n=1 Tax=Westerdykella ornata TaxID=318751 RepID=A0A6A6K0B5_WESOR|nr:uncharacterized protein EI97DRAFT_368619 [Westerdykella ornata]KAF2281486.1 hypothetical protein EI97DRAFT_368619 [Westerdykella ornata]